MAKITNYLKQDGSMLVAQKPFMMTIDMSNYTTENMRRDEETIWVKSLLSKAEFSDTIFDIVLDYPVNIPIYGEPDISKEFIKLNFDQNSTILEVSTEAAESKVQISYVERLIGGKEILKDASHLFRKLFAVYGPTSDMDSVHLEVLCSQVLRDRDNPHIPARLGKTWNPVLMNLKKVIFSEGFINSLAFENINEAIKVGLISDEEREPSVIERVMTGNIAETGKGGSKIGGKGYQYR